MKKSVIKVLSSLLIGATMMCIPSTSLAAQSNKLVNNNKMAQKGYVTNLGKVIVSSYGCGSKQYKSYETGSFTRSELENNGFWIKLYLKGYGSIVNVGVEDKIVKCYYDTGSSSYYGSTCSKKITISDDIFQHISEGEHNVTILVQPSMPLYGDTCLVNVTFNLVEG